MRIEAGKWYLNREGNCVGPMRRYAERGQFYWEDGEGCRLYFPNGRTRVGEELSPHDLVKEWINPNTPPPIPPQYANADTSYSDLISVLKMAHAQAATGKGKERHANGRAFDRQPIMEIGRMVGPSFAAGQAMKKAQEAVGMISRHNNDAAVQELLGAINYLAACVMLIQESQV